MCLLACSAFLRRRSPPTSTRAHSHDRVTDAKGPVVPTVAVNGIRLYYETAGSGFPLVNLHGSGSGRRNFARVSPLLAADFTVVDYDMRGFGASDAPVEPYSMEAW